MNDNQILALSAREIEEVSGGALPLAWAVGVAVTGAFGGGFSAGYLAGSDKWGN